MTDRSHRNAAITFGLLCLILIGDHIVPFALGPSFPNYSQLHDTLSTLGTARSPVAAAVNAWLIGFGIVLALLAFGEWRRAGPAWRGRAYALGLLGFAVGAGVLAGACAEDLPGEAETLHGKIHGISAGLGSLALLIGLPFGAAVVGGSARWLTRALAVLAWLFFAIFLTAKAPDAYAGLWQKLYLGAAYGGVLTVAAGLRWGRR